MSLAGTTFESGNAHRNDVLAAELILSCCGEGLALRCVYLFYFMELFFFSFSILATRSSSPSTDSFLVFLFFFGIILITEFYRFLPAFLWLSDLQDWYELPPPYTSANGVKEAEKKGFNFPTNAKWIFSELSLWIYSKCFLLFFLSLLKLKLLIDFHRASLCFLNRKKRTIFDKVSVSDRIDCEMANKDSCGFSIFNHFLSTRVFPYASTAASAPHFIRP